MGKQRQLDTDKFVEGMKYCKTHQGCGRSCPLIDECDGAYDMLSMSFQYIDKLEHRIKRLERGGKSDGKE